METPLPAATAATTAQGDPTIWRVDDALWALLAPILKSDKARKKPGSVPAATTGPSSTD